MFCETSGNFTFICKSVIQSFGFFFNITLYTENELNGLVNVPYESSPEKEYLQNNSGVM